MLDKIITGFNNSKLSDILSIKVWKVHHTTYVKRSKYDIFQGWISGKDISTRYEIRKI